MKCPQGGCNGELVGNGCPRCGSIYDAADVEELAHLDYLLEKLDDLGSRGEIPRGVVERVRTAVLPDRVRLERALGLRGPGTGASSDQEQFPTGPRWARTTPSAPRQDEKKAGTGIPAPPSGPGAELQDEDRPTPLPTASGSRVAELAVKWRKEEWTEAQLRGYQVQRVSGPERVWVGTVATVTVGIRAFLPKKVEIALCTDASRVAGVTAELVEGEQEVPVALRVGHEGYNEFTLEVSVAKPAAAKKPAPARAPKTGTRPPPPRRSSRPRAGGPQPQRYRVIPMASDGSLAGSQAQHDRLSGILEDLVDRLTGFLDPSRRVPTAALEQTESMVDALLADTVDVEESRPSEGTHRKGRTLPPLPDPASVFAGRDFSWKKIGAYLLSERTLNALLALGTFLILASGFVISTINPTGLPPAWHLGAVAATTITFHLVGYVVRFRLQLAVTGATVMAIGGAFIPLNVATLGQDKLLNWEPSAVWLVASLISLPLYLGFHALLRDRAFALFTALAGVAALLSFANRFGVSAEWTASQLVGLCIIYMGLGWQIRQGWSVLAWGLFWVAQTAVPLTLAGLKGYLEIPLLWQLLPGQGATSSLPFTVALTWWLGALFYWLCSKLSMQRRYRLAAVWTVPFAYLFTLDATGIDPSWYNFALALLPAGYALFGWWRGRLDASSGATRLRGLLSDPVSQVVLAATLEAAFWPNESLAARGPSLAVIAFTYAVYAMRFKELLVFRYVAAYLLAIAAALSLQQLAALGAPWFQPAWHNVVFAVLAGGYLLAARYGELVPAGSSSYRALVTEPVYQVAMFLALAAAIWPQATRESMLVTLLALAGLFVAATYLLGFRALAYVAVALILVAHSLIPGLLQLDLPATALAWAAFSGVMLVAAELDARRTGEGSRPLLKTALGTGEWRSRFASPLFLGGYAASVLAGVICFRAFIPAISAGPGVLPDPLVIAAGLIVVVTAAVSTRTRRASVFLYPAVVMFLVPYVASASHVSNWLGNPPSEGGLAPLLSILAFVYLATGTTLDRFGGHYAKPIYLAAYTLSVAAMLAAQGDRWARVFVVGVALLIYAWSAWRVHREQHPVFDWLVCPLERYAPYLYPALRSLFLYLTSWLLPLWVMLAIGLVAQVGFTGQYGVAAAILAPVSVVLAFRFQRIRVEYRWPWLLTGYVLSGLGPMLALGLPAQLGGIALDSVAPVPPFHPATVAVALGISIALYATSFIRYDRWPWLYLAAWLFPIWLAFALSSWEPRPSLGFYAISFAVLGLIYALLGKRFERVDRQYRRPWYLAAHVLSALAILLAGQETLHASAAGASALPYTPPLATSLLASVTLYAATFWSTLRSGWLILVAGLFPAGLLLAMRLFLPASPLDPYGVALAILATTYVALGWRLRRFGRRYQQPWFVAAYALSTVGPLLVLSSAVPGVDSLRLSHLASTPFLLSLAVSTGLYIVAAWRVRQPTWVYPGSALLALLLVCGLDRLAVGPASYGIGLILLALGYGVAGTAIHQGSLRRVRFPVRGPIDSYAMPLFRVGHLVTILALVHLLSRGPEARSLGLLLGSLVYIGSALVFRSHRFLAPAAATLAIAYLQVVLLIGVPGQWFGLALLPGIVASLATGAGLLRRLGMDWARPFFLLAHLGTVPMVGMSTLEHFAASRPWSSWAPTHVDHLALWGATGVFAASAWLLGSAGWLYPTLLCAVGAFLTALSVIRPSLSGQEILLALIAPAWLFTWAAHVISVRTRPLAGAPSLPLLGTEPMWSHRWASPFLFISAAIVASSVFAVLTPTYMTGIGQAPTGLLTVVAYAILLAALAVLWAGELEAWAAVGLVVLAFWQWLQLAHVPWSEQGSHYATLALGLSVLSALSRAGEKKGIAIWQRPLGRGSVAVGTLGLLSTAGVYLLSPTGWAMQRLAATLSILGLVLVVHGFARRVRLLCYLGVAVVQGGYMLELTRMQVGQPQAFALPAGIYLLVIAFLEWRRGDDPRLKRRIEQVAITLLLGVSLLQAGGQLGDGLDRYFYATFLFCESLALFALGAVLRWKRTFLSSISALVLDVFILLSDPLRAMNTWYLVGAAGLIMIALVLFAEQRRQQIPEWIDEWRQRLETWS